MDYQSQIAMDSGRTFVADAPVDERLVFLRKTYLLVLVSLGVMALGGWWGVKELYATVSENWLIFFIGYIAATFAVYGLRRVPVVNYLALGGFALLCGLILAPLLTFAIALANGQPTIVLQAVVITGTAITGLSGYVLVTRKDFSFLRGALVVGSFVLLGCIIVGFFVSSLGFHLLFSIGGAVLFCGFILYDTSRIVRTHPVDDHVGAAIDLFIDFFLLFLYVLRILVLLAASRD